MKKVTAILIAVLAVVGVAYIHGQHEHQSLMDEKRHLGMLDATGDENSTAALGHMITT